MYSQSGERPAANSSQSANVRRIGEGSTIAAFVASRREPLRVDDLQTGDARFPDGLSRTGERAGCGAGGALREKKDEVPVRAVLAYPVLVGDALVGVLAAYRLAGRLAFTLNHERVGELLFNGLFACLNLMHPIHLHN